MGQMFPSKEITVDARELVRARDIVNQLENEFVHLQNILEVMECGFNTFTCLERDSEISSLYIIRQYLKTIESTKIAVLSEKMDNIIKNQES